MADSGEEECTIRDYFNKGFTYSEILALLQNNHSIQMSIATLKRRVKAYGLKRRHLDYDVESIRDHIRTLLAFYPLLLISVTLLHISQRQFRTLCKGKADHVEDLGTECYITNRQKY